MAQALRDPWPQTKTICKAIYYFYKCERSLKLERTQRSALKQSTKNKQTKKKPKHNMKPPQSANYHKETN